MSNLDQLIEQATRRRDDAAAALTAASNRRPMDDKAIRKANNAYNNAVAYLGELTQQRLLSRNQAPAAAGQGTPATQTDPTNPSPDSTTGKEEEEDPRNGGRRRKTRRGKKRSTRKKSTRKPTKKNRSK